jgi:hypothetical protein
MKFVGISWNDGLSWAKIGCSFFAYTIATIIIQVVSYFYLRKKHSGIVDPNTEQVLVKELNGVRIVEPTLDPAGASMINPLDE